MHNPSSVRGKEAEQMIRAIAAHAFRRGAIFGERVQIAIYKGESQGTTAVEINAEIDAIVAYLLSLPALEDIR